MNNTRSGTVGRIITTIWHSQTTRWYIGGVMTAGVAGASFFSIGNMDALTIDAVADRIHQKLHPHIYSGLLDDIVRCATFEMGEIFTSDPDVEYSFEEEVVLLCAVLRIGTSGSKTVNPYRELHKKPFPQLSSAEYIGGLSGLSFLTLVTSMRSELPGWPDPERTEFLRRCLRCLDDVKVEIETYSAANDRVRLTSRGKVQAGAKPAGVEDDVAIAAPPNEPQRRIAYGHDWKRHLNRAEGRFWQRVDRAWIDLAETPAPQGRRPNLSSKLDAAFRELQSFLDEAIGWSQFQQDCGGGVSSPFTEAREDDVVGSTKRLLNGIVSRLDGRGDERCDAYGRMLRDETIVPRFEDGRRAFRPVSRAGDVTPAKPKSALSGDGDSPNVKEPITYKRAILVSGVSSSSLRGWAKTGLPEPVTTAGNGEKIWEYTVFMPPFNERFPNKPLPPTYADFDRACRVNDAGTKFTHNPKFGDSH